MDLDPTLMKSTNSTTGLRSFSVNTNAMNPATTRLSRRLLIFQEARNPSNMSEIVYLPVNKLGLPICGSGPELPSILELPLRILRAFTEIFNQPKYKGWYVSRPASLLLYHHRCIYIWMTADAGQGGSGGWPVP